MTKSVLDKLVYEARKSYGMRPINTPFGVKKARVVFYNTMLAHGVRKDAAQEVMKTAATPLQMAKPVKFTGAHLVTKGIMRDALKNVK